ncbi:MAG: hypothetical protein IGS39_01240 [Calothrix sp. C42_A2020_038]|nr:hypothetical protein [Calothrix sp. C42_A2020_038]
MKVEKKLIVPLLIVAVAASLSSCASNPNASNNIAETPLTTTPSAEPTPTPDIPTVTPTPTETITATPSPTAEVPSPKTTSSPSASVKPEKKAPAKTTLSYNSVPFATETLSGKTTDVTIYTSDSQCQEHVPKTTTVPANEPIAGAVGRALEGHDSGDFSLSGYRVNVKNGVATVELRVSPNSKRLLSSLSSCENFSLFGSVRKTLTSNSQWKIKDVRFIEKGQEIVF